MHDIAATAEDLEHSTEFEQILDDWTPEDARALVEQLNYCSVAIVHGAVHKAGVTLDIIASRLMGPFVSVTRYAR
jgi:hypothetical protein